MLVRLAQRRGGVWGIWRGCISIGSVRVVVDGFL